MSKEEKLKKIRHDFRRIALKVNELLKELDTLFKDVEDEETD